MDKVKSLDLNRTMKTTYASSIVLYTLGPLFIWIGAWFCTNTKKNFKEMQVVHLFWELLVSVHF